MVAVSDCWALSLGPVGSRAAAVPARAALAAVKPFFPLKRQTTTFQKCNFPPCMFHPSLFILMTPQAPGNRCFYYRSNKFAAALPRGTKGPLFRTHHFSVSHIPAPAPVTSDTSDLGRRTSHQLPAGHTACAGAAAPHQLLRVDLPIIDTSSSNVICHPNYVLPFRSLPASHRAELCPRAWHRSPRGRQSPAPAKRCSGNSLPQEQAFLHNQPALLSHWKGLDCKRQATGASSLAPREAVPSTRTRGAGCFPPCGYVPAGITHQAVLSQEASVFPGTH